MPTEPNAAASAETVLYVGPLAGEGADETWERAVRWESRWSGSPVPRVIARTPEQVDAFVAGRPDPIVLVRPGDKAPVQSPPDGDVLANFLRAQGVLVMCGAEGIAPVPGPPLPGPALLLTRLPLPPGRGWLPRHRHRARETECRAFAEARGLSTGPALTAMFDPSNTHPEGFTVVIHPDVTTPPAGSPDEPLWRWLRQGLVIRPWPTLRALTRSDGRRSREIRIGRSEGSGFSVRGAEANRHTTPSPPPPQQSVSASPAELDSESDAESGPPYYSDSYRAQAAPPPGYAGPQPSYDSAPLPDFLRPDADFMLPPPSTPASAGWPAGPPGRPHTPRDISRPLPHDGLYVRRNNAFGTRSALGVKELIEQGVIVGQEHIRFDDFVVSRDGQVPGPRSGEAIAVSHGLTAVTGEFKAHEATTHFVEIALKAGPTPADPALASAPLPVNFVFVVDTSGSMHGEKLDTVKSSLHTIYGQLRPTDCLGIITFDHRVRTVLPAATKEELERSGNFASVVSGLEADGGTDINLGVQYGIDEIGRNAVSGRTVNCLYLLSDGSPNSGERDWVNIRRNIGARVRSGLTVSCFGFGSDARMPELSALAGVAGGHSTFVTRPEQVKADLLEDLGRRDHLAAVDIQLRLDIDPAVEIRHVYGHDPVTDPRARAEVFQQARQAAERARSDYGADALPDIITAEKGMRIFAPDLAFEETYWVVLEVRVPTGREPSALGTATVQYVDTLARESRRHEFDLARDTSLAPETVLVHGIGLWTSEVTFHALDDLYERDKEAAKRRLERHLKALEAAHAHHPAPEFRDDRVTLSKFMSLADSLGTMVSFTDSPGGGFGGPAVQLMNDFGRVRSGHWARH
ncbi:VWA domain-containing protein [Streptomyces sp. 303MFCol5.2]|uniref:VWA domain-containing protein n=1 Tax=Streptomyces sp. 303MFCol5.2 TaxID=1172181 RepID=UPI0003719BCC|nr:VWA domain-containing protein [Streptomyces sp. 303MFCol5.2]